MKYYSFKFKFLHLILLLNLVFTCIYSIAQDNDSNKNIRFHPNPMADYTRMYFNIPVSGRTLINVYDLTGKDILNAEYFLGQGQHACDLEGINKGMYIVTVRTGRFIATARLMSAAAENNIPSLKYINISQE